MTKTYSIAEAKAHFAQLVHQAEEGQAVELTRRGRPVAVVLSIDDFRRLERPESTSWQAITRVREAYEMESLDLDPDEIFAIEKDPSPGPGFDW